MMKHALTVGVLMTAATWSGDAQASWKDGYLSVTNVRHDSVRVIIDRRSYGEVRPGDAEAFRLPAGQHTVQVVDGRGATIERAEVMIMPYAAEALILEAPAGELDITNNTAASVRVWVDGTSAQVLAPGQRFDLDVLPGTHEVKVTYRQHDKRRELMRRSYNVSPGEEEQIWLAAPTTTVVEVVNTYRVPVQLQLNGSHVGKLDANGATFIEVPVGEARLTFVDQRGRIIEQKRFSAAPFEERTVTAEGVRHGALQISNPLPIAVRLVRGDQERILQPHSTTSWERVRAGSRVVKVYRMSGELLAEMTVSIRPNATTQARVDPPREGTVVLSNRSNHTAYVYVDGRLVDEIAPLSQERLSVPVGPRQIRVTAGGRERFNQRLAIDHYDDAEIAFGRQGRANQGEVSVRW
jgi:hypothetical protein